MIEAIARVLGGSLQSTKPLAPGELGVHRLTLRLPLWPHLVTDWRVSYGKSRNLVRGADGGLSCAEVEVVRRLRESGRGAIWIDNFGAAPQVWRWASGSDRSLSGSVAERHASIKKRVREITGRTGGCWDVVAWNESELAYIECKGPGDGIKPGQRAWRAAGQEIEPSVDWLLIEWMPS